MPKSSKAAKEESREYIRKEISAYNKRYWHNFWYFVGVALMLGIVGAIFGYYQTLYFTVPSSLVLFCFRFGTPKTVSYSEKKTLSTESHKAYSGSLEQITCPHCGAITDAGEIFCPKCYQKIYK